MTLLDAALSERGEDARVDEARRTGRRRTMPETRLRAELAAGPHVGREFEILRMLRNIDRDAIAKKAEEANAALREAKGR